MSRDQVTTLLTSGALDGRELMEELLPLVYEELLRIAHRQRRSHRSRPILDTTELVHEAYLKLVDDTRVPVKSRPYFFGAAVRAMRQVLVDAARRRESLKRGSGQRPETLDEDRVAVDDYAIHVLELDEALARLSGLYPRQARVVECRFFGGLSIDETAAVLDISPRTVKRDWTLARAWLFRALETGAG